MGNHDFLEYLWCSFFNRQLLLYVDNTANDNEQSLEQTDNNKNMRYKGGQSLEGVMGEAVCQVSQFL